MTAGPTSFAAAGARSSHRRLIPPIALFAVIVVLWDLANTRRWVSDLILPRPGEVVVSVYEHFAGGLVWPHLATTLYETLAGFALAAVLGVGLAVAAGSSSLLRQMIYPYAVTLQILPMLSIAPILISAFGFGYTSKIVIAGMIAFFPIFVNALTGLLTPDPDAEELFRSLRAGKKKTFTGLLLPTAAPMIFAGLRIGLTLALAGAVVAELVSAQEGLGFLIQRHTAQLNQDDAFAVVLILTAMGLLLYGAINLIDHVVVFWRHPGRLTRKSRSRSRRFQRLLPPAAVTAEKVP
ncbi:ABC transporter permease [Spongiactinospora sp. TRM90649]|uniref:ABC transporter permease n=1 Tax=Spongiactinospora sp. TRM90649 TaxID=3031114 RepID=UPI0023F71565|nr:ABC transporter permease [Spongiactinospora sp. TRM90649]MDF5753578.1 ABC transporter permease [Spongiactinospora sp. TRM90649]